MTREIWRFIALLGLVALGVGLYLGMANLKVPALDGTQDCGSAFSSGVGADYQYAGSAITAACEAKKSDRRTVAIVVLAVGGVVFLYAGSQEVQAAKREEQR